MQQEAGEETVPRVSMGVGITCEGIIKRLLHAHSAVPGRPAQYAASVSSKNSLATVSGATLAANPGIGHCVV